MGERGYVTHEEFEAWRNRAAYLYLALGVVCFLSIALAFAQKSHSVRDLADAASRVTLERCDSQNDIREILRDSLVAQRKLSVVRYREGQLTPAQYRFAAATLDRSIGLLEPQPCLRQAEDIRSSIR